MTDVQSARSGVAKLDRLEAAAGKYGRLTGKQQKGIALILSGCAIVPDH